MMFKLLSLIPLNMRLMIAEEESLPARLLRQTGLKGEGFELKNFFRLLKLVPTGFLTMPWETVMCAVFILSCIGLSTGTLRAQAQVKFDAGVKGGLNLASVNSSAALVVSKGSVINYHGGVYAMVKIGSVFAIQPEVIYSGEGQEYKYFVSGFPSYKSTFFYFNFPLMLKFYVAEGLNLQIGPQFGFLNRAKGYTYTASGTGGPPTITLQPFDDYVKANNISLCVGAGWDLPFGLNFTLRYNGGLTDINRLTGQASQLPASPFGTSSANSSVVQFSVGYRLLKFGSDEE
jgi:hypothetical protein